MSIIIKSEYGDEWRRQLAASNLCKLQLAVMIPDCYWHAAGQKTDIKALNKGIEMTMRRGDRGFTLLELLVVLVIIGLLAGYVGPRYFSQIGKSESKVAQAQIQAFDKALSQYRIDVGRYPSTDQGLNALVVKPPNEPKWDGPYLSKNVPLDPWGKPYVYRYPGQKAEYELYSLGRDGQPGGTGDASDITNWN